MAEIFAQNGLGLVKASNNRIQGWMAVKEMLKPLRDENDKPALLITEECKGLIRNLPAIQHDDKNPSDCATEPHEITHILDALRYFCVTRTLIAERAQTRIPEDYEYDNMTDYDEEMTGGEANENYLTYGGG